MLRTFAFYTDLFSYMLFKRNRCNYINKYMDESNKKDFYKEIDSFVHKICSRVLKNASINVELRGIEHVKENETYLFASNHQSNLDTAIIFANCPKSVTFIAKEELKKVPLLGKIMVLRGSIFLNRNNNREAIKSMKEAETKLKDNESIFVFPEGTRSKTGELGEFKAGAIRSAFKTQTKVIPVSINGSRKCMESNKGWLKPGNVILEFLSPVDPSEFKDINEFNEHVKSVIENNIKQQQKVTQ